MISVLDKFPQGRLAAANEANWRAGFCTLMTDWPGGTVHREPGLIWHGSHVPHPSVRTPGLRVLLLLPPIPLAPGNNRAGIARLSAKL